VLCAACLVVVVVVVVVVVGIVVVSFSLLATRKLRLGSIPRKKDTENSEILELTRIC
jgi:hypothetical protein